MAKASKLTKENVDELYQMNEQELKDELAKANSLKTTTKIHKKNDIALKEAKDAYDAAGAHYKETLATCEEKMELITKLLVERDLI